MNFSYIVLKLKAVIIPNSVVSNEIADDADMAGPFIFALVLGALMLLSGKLNFGYVFGFGCSSCVGMYCLLSLLAANSTGDMTGSLDFWLTASVLGYCLISVIGM